MEIFKGIERRGRSVGCLSLEFRGSMKKTRLCDPSWSAVDAATQSVGFFEPFSLSFLHATQYSAKGSTLSLPSSISVPQLEQTP